MNWLRRYPVVFFFLLAYFFVCLQALFPNPFFSILGVASPTLAAVLMLALLRESKNLLAALFQWRAAASWYFVAILGQPLIAPVVVAILFLLGQTLDNFLSVLSWEVLPAIFIGRLLTSVWEEVGWRRFALPRLQFRTNALVASLIMGIFAGMLKKFNPGNFPEVTPELHTYPRQYARNLSTTAELTFSVAICKNP